MTCLCLFDKFEVLSPSFDHLECKEGFGHHLEPFLQPADLKIFGFGPPKGGPGAPFGTTFGIIFSLIFWHAIFDTFFTDLGSQMGSFWDHFLMILGCMLKCAETHSRGGGNLDEQGPVHQKNDIFGHFFARLF